jgi:tubulin--tyrosine ligase
MKQWLGKLSHFRFYLPQTSPTYQNLARFLQAQNWLPTDNYWLANFSDKNFSFDIAAAECLEFKHHLAQLVTHYCPEVMPETYPINDNNWSLVLSDIAEKYYMPENRLIDKVDNLAWILKPALLNNGQNIKIFDRVSQIEQHYLSSQRLGGPHVLQRYITNPHLLENKKYSIRMFVIVTDYAGVYLYKNGYFNVAINPYEAQDFSPLNVHLTNEHLSEPDANVVQIPTQHFGELFSAVYPQIKTVVNKTISALQHAFPLAFKKKYGHSRHVAIFGFDFMVDETMKVWLLEANHGPCFPVEDKHPLQQVLYFPFWQDLIHGFVFPMAKAKKAAYDSFDKID